MLVCSLRQSESSAGILLLKNSLKKKRCSSVGVFSQTVKKQCRYIMTREQPEEVYQCLCLLKASEEWKYHLFPVIHHCSYCHVSFYLQNELLPLLSLVHSQGRQYTDEYKPNELCFHLLHSIMEEGPLLICAVIFSIAVIIVTEMDDFLRHELLHFLVYIDFFSYVAFPYQCFSGFNFLSCYYTFFSLCIKIHVGICTFILIWYTLR